jgi:dihydropteroate synthase
MNHLSPDSVVSITCPSGRQFDLRHPVVMGILNVTPDSFSDGGDFASVDAAVKRAKEMIAEGAAIIDIGGESSRPGADPVEADEEIKRVVPVISAIRKQSDIPISIDTYKSATAKAALDAGADIVNDISALRFDPAMAELVSSTKAPLVLMHMLGDPRTMQENPHYDDPVREINQFFDERIKFATSHGINREKLILDPGLGFGKRPIDNVAILSRLKEFHGHGLPLLVGASRKSFIGVLDPGGAVDRRLGGSIAAAMWAAINGASIIRVHDVRETVQALKVLKAVK